MQSPGAEALLRLEKSHYENNLKDAKWNTLRVSIKRNSANQQKPYLSLRPVL